MPFFAEVQSGYEDTIGGKWLQNTLKEHTAGYEIFAAAIQRLIRKLCGKFLKYVFEAVKQLTPMEEKELFTGICGKADRRSSLF